MCGVRVYVEIIKSWLWKHIGGKINPGLTNPWTAQLHTISSLTKMAKKDIKKEVEGDILDDVLSDDEVKQESKETKEESKEEPKEESEETTEDAKDNEKETDKTKEDTKEDKDEADTKKSEDDVTTAAIEKETKPALPKKDDKEDAPPPKPARPPTPRQQALKSLQEAFPTVEEKYIQSHLIASGYNLEQAFNALLYLSDPESFNIDEVIPPQQASEAMAASTAIAAPAPALPQRRLTQLEEDELLAKSLDEEYRRKADRRSRRQADMRRQRTQQSDVADEDSDDLISNFVEKDLPQIKEQLSKNIEETKNKFNTWVSGWKKQYSTAQQDLNNRNIKKQMRDEFDAEPEEVDLQKFHGIKLSDDTEEVKPKTPARNRAGSTDIYGTPKHKEQEKKDDAKKKSTTSADDDDDDFLLSD